MSADHIRRGMCPPLSPIAVAPTGKHSSMAFVSRSDGTSGIQAVELDDYPQSLRGIRLRAERVGVEPFLSMGDLARFVGLRAVDVSSLERGSATLDDLEWDRLFAELAKAKGRSE